MPITTLKSLQILRFIAATSVVYFHIDFDPRFGYFGIDIFFVISGFVIALIVTNKESASHFAISRITRIVPIYWLLTTILLIGICVLPQYFANATIAHANFQNYIKSLFFIPYFGANGMYPLLSVGWTLNYEMFFYICVWLSLLITKRYVLVAAFFLLLLSYLIFGNYFDIEVMEEFFGKEVIFEFILGFFAYFLYSVKFFKMKANILFFIIALTTYILMAYFESIGYSGNRLLLYGIPSSLLVLSVTKLEALFHNQKNLLISIFINLGDASYATYLTHWFVIVFFREIFYKKFDFYNFYSITGVFITIIIVLLVGQFTYKYLDRPLNKKLSNL